jgi:hypothetical protein
MHFFYLDESGDTGNNLIDAHQPVMVIGGISVRDEGWNATQEALSHQLTEFFGGALPPGFELHAKDLLSTAGDGFFAGQPFERRRALCLDLLALLAKRSHGVHYIALDKQAIGKSPLSLALPYDYKQPYLLGFDYLITYINWQVKERLGQSARGMIILDKKDQHHAQIEQLMHERRFGGVAAHRVKWVVEASYAVDSDKNPMIQLSDVVIYCVKRFIEVERGYRNAWPPEAKLFYAKCYSLINERIARARLVERGGRNMEQLTAYLKAVRAEPRTQWRRHYAL